MRSHWERARKALLFSLRYYANVWVLLVLQLAFFVLYNRSRILVLKLPGLWAIAVGLSVVSVGALLNLGLARVKQRYLAAVLNVTFVALYAALLMYRWRRGAPIDFALLANSVGDLLTPFGWRGLGEQGGVLGWSIVAGAILVLAVLERRLGSLSTFYRFERPWRIAGVLLICNALFIAVRIPNELLLFLRSTGHYAFFPFQAALHHADSSEPFPLYRQDAAPERPPAFTATERPHVVLVLMESFSADFVERREPDGREITPYFNALIGKGAYHEVFFANSMQTERGTVATLCSLIPSFRRKVMTTHFDDHFRCLPELLAAAGYETTWAQALADLTYDNAGAFMHKNGFEHVISMDDRFVGAHDKKYLWGWGLEDDIFFRKTFGYLDTLDLSKPQFVALATTSNHTPFDGMPWEERRLFAQPASFEENYKNSIHLADAYLAALFEEIAKRPQLANNTLVLLVGDHGFPVGQHGVTSNEVSYYNELFRVPFLVLGPRVTPFRNGRVAYSQLDIPPALLEWLGITASHAFSGVSIPFREADLPADQHFIPLIQPYDGGYLMAVRYPHKYVTNMTTDEAHLFDLAADPREERDLASEWGSQPPVPLLIEDIARIYLNQRLLDEDRFIPH
jgi:glucan phosphoethanolaminetransferase (alkaline phosphatase superfamily)